MQVIGQILLAIMMGSTFCIWAHQKQKAEIRLRNPTKT